MGRFGENREFAVCAYCGHPKMAHMGGSPNCGCRGSGRAETAHSDTVRDFRSTTTEQSQPQAASEVVEPDWIAAVRKQHPRAYERWTADEDARLGEVFGGAINGLASTHGRQPSAIVARLKKLGLIE